MHNSLLPHARLSPSLMHVCNVKQSVYNLATVSIVIFNRDRLPVPLGCYLTPDQIAILIVAMSMIL
jgi:hypothetical protein